MSWRIWTGKYGEEARYLRGLVDEIMVICEEYIPYENYNENSSIIDWTETTLVKEVMQAIKNTQNEYEGAKKDQVATAALTASLSRRRLLEIKQLRQEINQLPIDLHESLDMILEAHHPEVRESVMSMFGDAWGNNVVGYDE